MGRQLFTTFRDEKGQLGCGFSPSASSECKNAILFSLLVPHEVTLQMQKENMLNVAKGDHFVTMLTIFLRNFFLARNGLFYACTIDFYLKMSFRIFPPKRFQFCFKKSFTTVPSIFSNSISSDCQRIFTIIIIIMYSLLLV